MKASERVSELEKELESGGVSSRDIRDVQERIGSVIQDVADEYDVELSPSEMKASREAVCISIFEMVLEHGMELPDTDVKSQFQMMYDDFVEAPEKRGRSNVILSLGHTYKSDYGAAKVRELSGAIMARKYGSQS